MHDALHNRVQKTIVKNNQSATKEFYIRDAQGNTLAVYEFFDNKLVWKEQHLYGAERIGTYMVEATLYNANTSTTTVGVAIDDKHLFEDNEKTKDGAWVAMAYYVGLKRYEITNHLGNVLAVVTDRRMPDPGAHPGSIPGYWQAEVVQVQDYYVFGAKVPNRCWDAGEKYRYGFNGKENDDEVLSDAKFQDYGMRLYRPDLGRFVSVDPLAPEYPFYTPYQFASNTPIAAIDLDGLEAATVAGAIFGGLIGGGAELYKQVKENGWSNVSWKDVGKEAGKGSIEGAVAGAVIDLTLYTGGAAAPLILSPGGLAMVNSASAMAGNLTGQLLDNLDGSREGYSTKEMVQAGVIGAGFGYVGSKIQP